MTLNEEILRIGDLVREKSETTIVPGRIIGFEETIFTRFAGWQRVPGIYQNKSYARVEFQGRESYFVSSSHLTLVDSAEEERRFKALKEEYGNSPIPPQFLRDLPETKYYEEDVVKFPRFRVRDGYHIPPIISYPISLQDLSCLELEIVTAKIQGIDYGIRREGESQYYVIKGTRVQETTLKLIQRGNVWKYYHNQSLTFRTGEEEVDFFRNVGQFDEVKNPETNSFHWKRSQYINGIVTGIIDAPYSGSPYVLPDDNITAIRFKNEELGARVRSEIISRMLPHVSNNRYQSEFD